jgi:predicted RNA-binding protein with PUA-like domain
MKTEPGDYSWEHLVEDGSAVWDGVHNHQAARNMRAMKKGDRAFFYRSMQDPAVVGVMEIVREAYQDPGDPKESFVLVDVAPVMPVRARSTPRPGG